MDVFEAIRTRRSVRSYEAKQVEPEKLEQVLDAGRLAPSARNLQQWRFVVVREEGLRIKLSEAAHGQRFVAEAPVVIVACAVSTEHIMPCGIPSHLIDVAIAVDHMTLAARGLGLGTCWIGAFDPEGVKQVLGIPTEAAVVGLLPLGYPLGWPQASARKPLSEIVCYDAWE